MSCPQWEEALNDFVDGSAQLDDAAAVERHLADCRSCRDTADALRTLLGRAASLPHRIEPARDLWPAIADDLGRPRSARRWPAIAAAMLILAAAATTSTMWRSVSTGGSPPSGVVVARYLDDDADLREAEEEFRKATTKLMVVLERRKAQMSPQAVAELERNLRVVNDAIAEIGAAMERDPDNPRLERLFADVYSTKVELLRSAVRAAGAA